MTTVCLTSLGAATPTSIKPLSEWLPEIAPLGWIGMAVVLLFCFLNLLTRAIGKPSSEDRRDDVPAQREEGSQ